MNRSFVRNLALVVTCLTVLILATLPAYEVTVAQTKPSATPSKTAPATAKGIQRIIFVANKDGAGNIFAMNPDGKNIVQLTNSDDIKLYPTFSPDGRQIAFLSTARMIDPPQLKVMDADGKNLRQLPIGKAEAISPPAWSPDSSEIAYISVRTQAKDSGIYIFNITKQQEAKLKLVTPTNFFYKPSSQDTDRTIDTVPSWSPDGKSLLVAGGLGNASQKTTLLISLSDGKARAFLQDSSFIAFQALWSPDGSKVLVTALKKAPDAWPLWQLTDAEGKVLNDNFYATSYANSGVGTMKLPQLPVWSPNSKRIAFTDTTFATGTTRIYVMTIDSLVAYQITTDDFSDGDTFPSWGIVPAELVKQN